MAARLVVVGGGKMGEALVRGLLSSGWARPEELVLVEVSARRRAELLAAGGLASDHPGLEVVGGPPPAAEGAVVAVKPPDVEGACLALSQAGVRRVLSIAAGVPISQLEPWCGPGAAVVRAMPNMAALVCEAATAIAGSPGATRDDVEWAASVLRSVGTVTEVPEHLLDVVTGVSGSGPAFIFLVAEALTEAGVLMGLSRAVAGDLVTQTVLGSARLLEATGQGPAELRAAVTSPAGTTAAGLRQLEARGARSAFLEAVAAAVQRSRELGAAPG